MAPSLVRRVAASAAARTFSLWERLGLHVTPVHFYQPIPDTRKLDRRLWQQRSTMPGVALDDAAMLSLLDDLRDQFEIEYAALPLAPTADPQAYFIDNGWFTSVDAEVLYSLVRTIKPRRMIEIGSGMSTLLAAQALRKNELDGGQACDFVSYDPFPRDVVSAGVPALTRLEAVRAQDVPLAPFESLAADDILFIDSSHVLTIGSDVQYLFLEVVPRLAPGVYVHVHDIFMPAEYPRPWVLTEHRFWTEQYLLQAFLAFNSEWDVIWAGSYMHLEHPSALAAAFPSYGPSRHPGSFWMRRRPSVPAGPQANVPPPATAR
jgi:methyltransferase family protein